MKTEGTKGAVNITIQPESLLESAQVSSKHCIPNRGNRPTVALLISTYNWEEALSLCLRSAFTQTVKPNEIVIADDGSRQETRELIDRMRRNTDIPVVHVWHEDKGFRKTTILNKAIKKITSAYIIQIDGDIVMDKNFIADHLELVEEGYFVCGSRVGLSPELTQQFFKDAQYHPFFLQLGLMYMFNSIRSKAIRHYLEKRYYPKDIERLRGCNMAFWKRDLLHVNGYNEDMNGWGQEDTEIAYRLVHSGIKKKFLKGGGIEYHLYHKPVSKENLKHHNQILQMVIDKKSTWCKNGIIKSLFEHSKHSTIRLSHDGYSL